MRELRFQQCCHPKRRLMFVKDDSVLTAKAESAMTFHVDRIPRFAFPSRVDRLDGSDEPIAG
jgi:hypothetical protein